MWKRLIKGTEFSELLEYVSPKFFEVLPPRQLVSGIRKLIVNYRDAQQFAEVMRSVKPSLAQYTTIEPDVSGSRGSQGQPLLATDGDEVLKLYFAQLFHCDSSIVDVRSSAFYRVDGQLRWSPKPVYHRWEPEFLSGLRLMYRGFYEDDRRLFQQGTAALHLQASESILLDHFGAQQNQVRFNLADFRQTFHKVFVTCKTHHVQLHPDFLILGIYLAFLYEHLQERDASFAVRDLFESVVHRGDGVSHQAPAGRTPRDVAGSAPNGN